MTKMFGLIGFVATIRRLRYRVESTPWEKRSDSYKQALAHQFRISCAVVVPRILRLLAM